MVDAIRASDHMILVMAPEGTRKAATYWKSGFLQIAAGAEVPIVLAYVDYPNKRVGMGPLVSYEGDASSFMDQARLFYADKVGRHPEGKGPVAIREETEPS